MFTSTIKKKHNLQKRKVFLLGIIIIIIGISLTSYEYFLSKKNYAFEYMNNKLYLSSSEMPEYLEPEDEEGVTTDEDTYDENLTVEEITQNTNNQNTNTNNNGNNKNNTQKQDTYYYIGYLEIPKINFKKGFVDINSQDNVVSKNITIIKGSKYPDVEKGNFIIAGHSGTGVHSYFKNLYKLSIGDKAYVYYKNVKYTYKIVKIYNQEKDGTVAIYRDYNKTTLTLVTCTKNNKKSQTVYVAELESKTSY